MKGSEDGALHRWRDSLRQGEHCQVEGRPSTWTQNALWRAACHEAAGRDCELWGLFEAAKDSYERARRILGENRTEGTGRTSDETNSDVLRPLGRARIVGNLRPLSRG